MLEKSSNKRKTITDIIEARDPLYREVATIIIDTNGKKLNEVIHEILSTFTKIIFFKLFFPKLHQNFTKILV